jgi:hypothetical protein
LAKLHTLEFQHPSDFVPTGKGEWVKVWAKITGENAKQPAVSFAAFSRNSLTMSFLSEKQPDQRKTGAYGARTRST